MTKTMLPNQDVYLVTFSSGEILAICKDLNRLYEMNKKYLTQESARFLHAFTLHFQHYKDVDAFRDRAFNVEDGGKL